MSMCPYDPFNVARWPNLRQSFWPNTRSLARDFDDLFDSFIDNRSALRLRDNAGHLKFSDDGRSFEYRVNVSGYRPDDLKVDLEENSIIIQGEHKDDRPGESIHRHFTRRFVIPEGIDHQTIKCDLDEAGVLSLHGTKKAIDPSKKRAIPIGAKPSEKQGQIEGKK